MAEALKRALILSLAVSLLLGGPVGGAAEPDSWRPNFRIGPVKFNHDVPQNVDEVDRGSDGSFAIRPHGGGPIVRGVVFEDPSTGRPGARAVWTRSKRIAFRGVRVGMHWRTARKRLPGRWELRRQPRCGWLNSSRIRRDRTGPVSTQLFFRRGTGRIYEIALNEITEIGCPGD